MGYSQQVKEDAAKAAEAIRRFGWCKGAYRNRKRQLCMLGACRYATTGSAHKHGYRTMQLEDAIRPHVKTIVHRWNDSKDRTKEEVLAVFDRIANS